MSTNQQVEETLSKLNYCLDEGNLKIFDQHCTELLKKKKMELQKIYGVTVYPKKDTIMIKNGDERLYCCILTQIFEFPQEIPILMFNGHLKPDLLNTYKSPSRSSPFKKFVSSPSLSVYACDLSIDDFQPEIPVLARRNSTYEEVNIEKIITIPGGNNDVKTGSLNGQYGQYNRNHNSYRNNGQNSKRRNKRSKTDLSDTDIIEWSPSKNSKNGKKLSGDNNNNHNNNNYNRNLDNNNIYNSSSNRQSFVPKSKSESIIPVVNNFSDSFIVPQSNTDLSSDSFVEEVTVNVEESRIQLIGSQRKVQKLKQNISELLGLPSDVSFNQIICS